MNVRSSHHTNNIKQSDQKTVKIRPIENGRHTNDQMLIYASYEVVMRAAFKCMTCKDQGFLILISDNMTVLWKPFEVSKVRSDTITYIFNVHLSTQFCYSTQIAPLAALCKRYQNCIHVLLRVKLLSCRRAFTQPNFIQ